MNENNKQEADETKKKYASNQASQYVKDLMNAKTNPTNTISVSQERKEDANNEVVIERDMESEVEVDRPNNQPIKRRKVPSVNQSNYKEVFMIESSLKGRQSVYVSKELHLKLSNYLSVIGGKGFSIGVYIDNILNHHLAIYKKELDELYRMEVDKLLNQ